MQPGLRVYEFFCLSKTVSITSLSSRAQCGGPTLGKHAVIFALNANFLNKAPVLGGHVHSFAGIVHNEDTKWNIDQIMSIFLGIILRDFLIYIIN